MKDTTDIYHVRFQTTPHVKIKIEVDVDPPLGFSVEPKLLMMPFSFMVQCYTLPDLFAGKVHAWLFRGWNNRVKGRDWYDFEWYVRHQIPMGFEHFVKRAEQTHGYDASSMSIDVFKRLLKERILSTDIHLVKNDVRPFEKNPSELEIWSTDYFLKLIDYIHFNKN